MSIEKPPTAKQGRPRDKRQGRGLATRERILRAATTLLVRDGYLHTTMASIAAEAGVAVQSLYLRFGSKVAILKAVLDVAIVGDFEPVPLLDRKWVQELAATEDGQAAVHLYASVTARILSRTHAIYAVVQAAAAGEAGELLAENKRQRHEGQRTIAELLGRKPGVAPGLTVDTAADLIYGLVSEDLYGLLVVDRGWSTDEWERWCADILGGVLFPTGSTT